MDVLIARTPSGHLHGVSCANPPGFAETYIATMRRQGCTVEQIPMSEWATRQHLRTAPVGKGGNWTPDEAPPAAVPETPSPALDAVQDAPGAAAPALPVVGDRIVHPVIGPAAVTHHIGPPDARRAVASGPRGSGVVEPGRWLPAQASSAPEPPTPLPSPAPKPPHMPSLFDLSRPGDADVKI